MTKFEAIRGDLEKSVQRLEEVLKLEKTALNRDAAIKRFELAFDLAWKTIKTYLEEEKNIIRNSPTDCFREAFQQGLIEYDRTWLEIAQDRNRMTHIYNEQMAEDFYQRLPAALEHFQKLLAALQGANR